MFRKSLYSSIGGRQEQPNPYQKYLDIKAKYKGIDLHDALFHESVWESMFDEGFIASTEINEAIKNCKYFQSENQPNWVRLWHGRDLSDSDFETVLEAVISEWQSMVFTEIGIVKHVAGILLWLSEIKLYRKTKKQILAFSKRYVDQLKTQGYLLSNRTNQLFALANSSWGGLGFHNNDDDTFKELLEYISKKENETIIESYPSQATVLLNSMKNDTDKFYRYLVLCNHADNKYYEIPILAYVSPPEFVKTYLDLTPNQRSTVAYAFEERYKVSQFNQKLVSEIRFLRKVISLLNKARTSRKGKISSYTIGLFVDYYLKKSVAILEPLQSGGATDQTTTSG